MKNSAKFGLLVWGIAAAIIIPILAFCAWWDTSHPGKSTYQKVQDFRNEQDYYIWDGEEWVEEYYGLEEYCDSFSYNDMIKAYNDGLNDGIEQTIDYFESLED